MGKLKVDLERVKKAKKEIDAYIQVHKQSINEITNAKNQLANLWQGNDAMVFQNQFEQLISGSGSESEVLLKKMTSFSEYLDYVYKSYSDEQLEACSRAAKL